MYIDDIKDLRRQKREARREILIDFMSIYLKLVIGFPGLVKEREDLVRLVQQYFDADRNESDVLNSIQKHYGKLDDHEGVDELLTEFDEMFENLYSHCQNTFLDYEKVMGEYGDFLDIIILRIRSGISGEDYEPQGFLRIKMIHRPISFPMFDEDYKKKMLEMVPKLPEPEDGEF